VFLKIVFYIFGSFFFFCSTHVRTHLDSFNGHLDFGQLSQTPAEKYRHRKQQQVVQRRYDEHLRRAQNNSKNSSTRGGRRRPTTGPGVGIRTFWIVMELPSSAYANMLRNCWNLIWITENDDSMFLMYDDRLMYQISILQQR